MTHENTEFVSVPVPVQHVTAVYELIPRLDAAGQPSPEGAPSNDGTSAALTQPLFGRRPQAPPGVPRGAPRRVARQPVRRRRTGSPVRA